MQQSVSMSVPLSAPALELASVQPSAASSVQPSVCSSPSTSSCQWGRSRSPRGKSTHTSPRHLGCLPPPPDCFTVDEHEELLNGHGNPVREQKAFSMKNVRARAWSSGASRGRD